MQQTRLPLATSCNNCACTVSSAFCVSLDVCKCESEVIGNGEKNGERNDQQKTDGKTTFRKRYRNLSLFALRAPLPASLLGLALSSAAGGAGPVSKTKEPHRVHSFRRFWSKGATRNKGHIATRSKDATRGSWPYY